MATALSSLPTPPPPPRAVLALGGNAITPPDGDGSVEHDYENLGKSLDSVVALLERGYQLTLTHGNGPQVGNQMLRVELTRDQAPDLPLDLMVADIQGGLGYMMELVLRNKLQQRGLSNPVCALITLVEVDRDDPAFAAPSKFVGGVYSAEQAEQLRNEKGWMLKEDRGRRGWRRVVPSPQPRVVVERDLIASLMATGTLVINTGGGGVPVVRQPDGQLVGVEGVVDKDLASAVLALQLGAPELFILTGVEQVMLGYGTPEQRPLSVVTSTEARAYLAQGHFPAGSMGPKIEAACRFVEGGGHRALITDIFTLSEALDGLTGTWVVP